MTTLAAGSSITLTVGDGGTVTVATNGGLASVTVTPNAGAAYTLSIGPGPARHVFGANTLGEGGTVVIANDTASLDYDFNGGAIGLTAAQAAALGTAQVVIFAGQSQANSNGTTGADVPANLQGAMRDVYTWDPVNFAWVPYQAGTGGTSSAHLKGGLYIDLSTDYWGAEAEYARRWRIDNPGVPLYIIKKAYSSSSLDQLARTANRGCWDPTLVGDLYTDLTQSYAAATASLIAMGKTLSVRAMHWIQGENDAGNATAAANYATTLTAFIAAIRSSMIGTSAPFIISRIQTGAWSNPAPVRAAQIVVAEGVANCRWVDADNLPLAADNVHYNPAGVVSLGGRLYDASCTAAELTTRYVNKMAVAPSAARKGVINAMFAALLDRSVWPTLVALQLYATHDAQAATLNAQSGALRAAPTNCSFAIDRGYTGSGTGSYVDTSVIPSSVDARIGVNGSAWSVWNRTNAVATGVDFGSITGGTLQANINGSYRVNTGNVTADNTVSGLADVSGLLSFQRSAAAAESFSRNGVQVGATDAVNAAGALPTASIQVGNRNGGTNPSTRQYAAFAAGGPRTANQEAALYSALSAYMTAVGA